MNSWKIIAAALALVASHGAMATDAPAPKPRERAVDRLQLDSTAITGNANCPRS